MCVFVCFLSLTPGLTRQGVRAFLGDFNEYRFDFVDVDLAWADFSKLG